MDEPAADTLATVAQLRHLVARLEQPPLEAAAEVLIRLEHPVDELRRARVLALERAPAGAG